MRLYIYPARHGQLKTRIKGFFLFPFATENLVSQDSFGLRVPRPPAHYSHSGWIWYADCEKIKEEKDK